MRLLSILVNSGFVLFIRIEEIQFDVDVPGLFICNATHKPFVAVTFMSGNSNELTNFTIQYFAFFPVYANLPNKLKGRMSLIAFYQIGCHLHWAVYDHI